jgi:hypothetical protein
MTLKFHLHSLLGADEDSRNVRVLVSTIHVAVEPVTVAGELFPQSFGFGLPPFPVY